MWHHLHERLKNQLGGLKHENLGLDLNEKNYYNNEINYWLGDNLSISFILSFYVSLENDTVGYYLILVILGNS